MPSSLVVSKEEQDRLNKMSIGDEVRAAAGMSSISRPRRKQKSSTPADAMARLTIHLVTISLAVPRLTAIATTVHDANTRDVVGSPPRCT